MTSASTRALLSVPADVDEVTRLVETVLSAGRAEERRGLVVQTSGSTGVAKSVVLSVRALRASAQATEDRLGGPGQWVLALPAQYVAGLQVIVRSALAGTPVVHLDPGGGPRAVVEAVELLDSPRRYLSVVPTQLHRWLGGDDQEAAAALAELDAVLVGGAPAGSRLLARARAAGLRVVTTYGMSETCGGCVYDGVPLDGVAVALGASGHLRVAGPVLFDGYDDRPDLTAQVLRDGWLHTPDLGELDADGRLVVLGRADDVVMSGGVNVPLRAVEERLADLPGVEDVVVAARTDPEWGTRVVAVVVSSSPAAVPELEAVRDHVSAVHPRAWAPREVLAVDALPLLSSGKVDRRRLAEQLGLLARTGEATS